MVLELTLPEKKRIRIGFIKNLVPGIQPGLKVGGAKYFITGVKMSSIQPVFDSIRCRLFNNRFYKNRF
jgi:hypothetical protein